MLDLGLIGFTQPWLLAALVALPAIWWLLRIIPPAPQLIRFPAVRFLLGIEPEQETQMRTPLWLLLLRLLIAALLILALAGPLLNPEAELAGDGPLVLVVDDGWAAAPGWDRRIETLERFTERALRQNREIILLGTAPDPMAPSFRRIGAADALPSLQSWQVKAWPVDRAAALERLLQAEIDGAELVWLTDGIAENNERGTDAQRFAEGLRGIGPLTLITDPPDGRALLLQPPDNGETSLVIKARRPAAGPARDTDLRAYGPGGEVLVRRPLSFAAGATSASAEIDVPLELRNRIARFDIGQDQAVGGVVLLDERWRRRAVGLVGLGADQIAQPLLSELFYIERALSPFAELRQGDVASLLAGELSAVILTDDAQLSPNDRVDLDRWIDEGGVLLRFAGPRLANADQDPLTPVPLRRGDRSLDGTLSWARPLPLASFDDNGPLADLAVQDDDVVVHRQVLAEPGPALAAHSWARLEDGTPLITGRQEGEGWLVLVHTTANTSWSSLPLSGSFVEMLRRIVELGAGVGVATEGLLAPIEVLNAGGILVEPGPRMQPLEGEALTTVAASALHPPGLYGRVGSDKDSARQALNLASAVPNLQALAPSVLGEAPRDYERAAETPLMPWLLALALLLALVDTVIGLWLRGLLPGIGRRTTLGPASASMLLLVLTGVVFDPGKAWAQSDERAIRATSETHLAYVVTGLGEVDDISRAGLEGLSLILNRRTAIEAGDPLAVDLEEDDLNLYPLLYWPIPPAHPNLSEGVRNRIDVYLRQGGMILFDTADAGNAIPGQSGPGAGERRLRQLFEGVSLPPLSPVPEDHTLTRSFYLLQDFPGRWTGRTVWVDRPAASVNDGVSSVIVGSHGWAGAWAIDTYAIPMFPVLPGGERQREIARRFGVNLVMYALTGNYKTDQVHIPALLERLGQ